MFQIQWPEYLYSYIQVIIGIAVIFRYMILKPKNIDSIILILIILAAFLISRDRSAIGSVLETGLLIIGAKEIDYKKILKVYLGVQIPLQLLH